MSKSLLQCSTYAFMASSLLVPTIQRQLKNPKDVSPLILFQAFHLALVAGMLRKPGYEATKVKNRNRSVMNSNFGAEDG